MLYVADYFEKHTSLTLQKAIEIRRSEGKSTQQLKTMQSWSASKGSVGIVRKKIPKNTAGKDVQ